MGYLIFGTYHDVLYRGNMVQKNNTVKIMITTVNKNSIDT